MNTSRKEKKTALVLHSFTFHTSSKTELDMNVCRRI